MKDNSTAVIVINYRQDKYLPALLDSIRRQTIAPKEIILVNNSGSAFDPGPRVIKIDNSRNTGFAAAVNLGIHKAMACRCSSFLVLNGDTKLASDCLEKLLDADKELVQPQVLLLKIPDRINTIGLRPTRLGLAYCIGYMRPAKKDSSVVEIPAFSGSAFFLTRSAYEKVGPFDERYFLYMEDVDYSLRARAKGITPHCALGSVVWHDYEFFRLGPKKMWHIFFNALRIRKRYRCLLRT
jgi:GT2 family glycosyltransferase